MSDLTCDSCRIHGGHKRWCVKTVGTAASERGRQAEQAHALAVRVGNTNPPASNALYRASELLFQQAQRLARAYQSAPRRAPIPLREQR